MSCYLKLGTVGLFFALLATTSSATITKPPPATFADFSGVWIGHDGPTAFYRLEFQGQNGLLLMQVGSSRSGFAHRAYRLVISKITGRMAVTTSKPLPPETMPVAVTIYSGGGELGLEERWVAEGKRWHRSTTLVRERVLLDQIRAASAEAKRYGIPAAR
jgi:hypothetical protein